MNELRTHFELLAERWDDLQSPTRGQALRNLLAPFASLLASSTAILEVGTGTGALIPCLQERAPAVALVSIDLAAEMLRRACRRCPDAAVVQANAQHPPFVAPHFDLVVCHNSFPHFADKPGTLSQLARLLQPGGHLLILHDLSRERVNAIHSSGGPAIQHDLLPTGEGTGRMLIDAGFVSVQVEDTAEHYIVAGQMAPGGQGAPGDPPAPI
jgi:ubiquinone/menaquinone biosynthesis C-methylase UbiE